MGVLNCQKCFHNENKNLSEIITGNNLLSNQKVLFALDSRKTSLSPKTNSDNFNMNKINCFVNKDKNKRISLKSKKESKTEEDYITDLDYETIEIPYDEIDSIEENENEEYFKNNNSESDYKIRLKNAEELFGSEKEFSIKNNSLNLVNNNNYIDINNEDNSGDKFKNDLIINQKSNLNDFINKKIKEKTANEFQKEEIKKEIYENINNNPYYQSNYNIIIGNNCLNYNYQYNLYNNNYNELGLSNGNNYKYINQKIDEENEEYEQEKEIINISDINNKYKSSTFSQYEIKNIEQNTINSNKNSIKSEAIKTRKETKKEENNKYGNIYSKNNCQHSEERSAISYEIECIDDNNNNNLENNYNYKNNLIGKEKININNEINIFNTEKDKKKIYFIENIERKINDIIDIIKDSHNHYIITDSFCDYEPEI